MATDPSIISFFQGQYIPLAEAKISVLTHGFGYGTGCFEGIRGYYNDEHEQVYLFRLPEHYDRLAQSARTLMMNMQYSPAELSEISLECIRRSNLRQDVYLRPMVYKSTPAIGVRLHDLEDDVVVIMVPFGNYIDIDRALKVGVSSWKRIDDNMIPARAKITGAYINSAFAKSEAQMNGFDEAIMLNSDGHVSEGSAENLFMYRKGVWVTPPVTENILEGITRDTVMTLLRDELGQRVEERIIDRTELYAADELFLCGTGAQIAPVGSVDHRQLADGKIGPITAQVQRLYFEVVRGNVPRYAHWCTPVYTPASTLHRNGNGNGNGAAAGVALAETVIAPDPVVPRR